LKLGLLSAPNLASTSSTSAASARSAPSPLAEMTTLSPAERTRFAKSVDVQPGWVDYTR